VRRLENTIIHALGNGDLQSPVITVADLPELLRAGRGDVAAEEEISAERLRAALTQAKGNRALAARILGISRTNLYRLLKELGEE
jgi:transcriptional regulator of acetoin/glycerol metabolism